MKNTKTSFFSLVPVLALIMMVSLASCNPSKDNDSSGDHTTPTPMEAQAQNPDSAPKPTIEQPSETNNDTGDTKGFTYIDGQKFSDGVAWVLTENRDRHLIDKTGQILIELAPGITPRSDFSSGVALISSSDTGIIELIDKTGKVISSPESGEYDRIMCIIPADLEISLSKAMIVVRKDVNTFALTETQYGIIDHNGGWVMPLGNYDFFKGRHSEGLYDSYDMIHHIDAGFLYNPASLSIYNVNTGEFIALKLDEVEIDIVPYPGASTTRYWRTERFPFISVSTGGRQGIMAVIDDINTGDIHMYNAPLTQDAYSDSRDSSGYNLFYANRLFYNTRFEVVIDLTEYNIKNTPAFSDGYAPLILANDGESLFFTVIDINGNFIFEPKPYKGSYSWDMETIYISSGVLVFIEGITQTVMDMSGNTIFEITNINQSLKFSEGLAIVARVDYENDRREFYYVDTTGRRVLN